MLANVKIEQDKENKHIHRVFVDGKKVDRVRTIDFCVGVDSAPEVNVEIVGGIDFEGQAEVNFLNDPFTVKKACKILLEELQKHGELYDGFKASIISAINDVPNYTPTEKVAERILNRMIGEG